MHDSITPFSHQLTGADFLAERGFALLADECGLGKSGTAILGADRAWAMKILVVCPATVRAHWAREFVRWQSISRQVVIADGFLDFIPANETVTIVSHAVLADAPSPKQKRNTGKSYPNLMAGAPYDLIIVDESHCFSAYDAARSRHLWMQNGVFSWSARVWCLSGTPMVNSPADLWLMAQGPMKQNVTWYDWGCAFSDPKTDNYGAIKFSGIKNTGMLANILRPHVLRRTVKGIGIELPDLSIEHRHLSIDPMVLTRVMADLEGWTPDKLIKALEEKDELHDSALARVRKALGMAKAESVANRVHGLLGPGTGPVVVFFQHTAVRDQLYASLTKLGYRVSWIDGKITRAQLSAAESWFQAKRLDVLLVQTQAGGMGLTLVAGNRVVVAELPWTAVGLWQAIKRVHRITQTKNVKAEIIRASGCWLEDALASAVGKKHRAAEELLTLLETTA